LPLSKKVRIEIFIPDPPDTAYRNLREELAGELSYAFGGCTEVLASGQFNSNDGFISSDRIKILFSDAPLTWEEDHQILAEYFDLVRRAAHQALPREEVILVSAFSVFHAE
jgi:hypothetical protein